MTHQKFAIFGFGSERRVLCGCALHLVVGSAECLKLKLLFMYLTLKFVNFSLNNDLGKFLENEQVMLFKTLERFSFECRKVIGFTFTTLRDWLKRFAPLFHPFKSKTKTNCDALACIFPRFASATCNYFEF